MGTKRILQLLLLLCVCFLGVQGRASRVVRLPALEPRKGVHGTRHGPSIRVPAEDFGVGEDRVEAVLASQIRERKAPWVVRQVAAQDHLDEIDRLKLSINKLICDSMEEGCDHMEDAMGDDAETFASLKPEEFVGEADDV